MALAPPEPRLRVEGPCSPQVLLGYSPPGPDRVPAGWLPAQGRQAAHAVSLAWCGLRSWHGPSQSSTRTPAYPLWAAPAPAETAAVPLLGASVAPLCSRGVGPSLGSPSPSSCPGLLGGQLEGGIWAWAELLAAEGDWVMGGGLGRP